MLSELTLGELFDYALEVLLILMEIKQSMVIQLQKKSQKLRSICFEDPSFFFILYVLRQSGDTLPGIGLLHEARLWGLPLATHAYP